MADKQRPGVMLYFELYPILRQMPASHYAGINTCNIDIWISSQYIIATNKETCLFGTSKQI